MPKGVPNERSGGATRESLAQITVSQFVYRAVSFRDTSIEESDRFKKERWTGAHTYREWLALLHAWRETQETRTS